MDFSNTRVAPVMSSVAATKHNEFFAPSRAIPFVFLLKLELHAPKARPENRI